MTGVLIFIGIVWGIFCLAMTKLNNSRSAEIRYREDRLTKMLNEYKQITDVTVYLKGDLAESITFMGAKFYDVGNEYLHVFDEHSKAVGLVPNREVSHVIIHRREDGVGE
jgi:hypothetical protein